jgi:hypothetical protein
MEKDLWKGVWKFKYPGKVRHFLWHFAHNSRALHMGLERRGMDFDTKCVMCGRLNEDGSHLFFKCKRVIPLWKELGLESVRTIFLDMKSAKEVVQSFLNQKEGEQMLTIMLLRQWWFERNRVREGKRMTEASSLTMVIAKMSDDFQAIGKEIAVKAFTI